MSEVVVKDGYEYTKSNGRLRYTPEFHFNQGKDWSMNDLSYLCGMWKSTSMRNISFALGRTEGSCCQKVCEMKRAGMFERLKQRFKE